MDWIYLSLASAFALGIYDVGKKAAVDGNALFSTLFFCSATAALVVLPLLLATLAFPDSAERMGIAVASLGPRGQLLVFLKTCIVTASWTLSFLALKHLPLSIAGPVRASAPLFTLVGAVVLFGERPSLPQWVGIFLILCSYWAFAALGRREGIHFGRSPWIAALFAATILGAASSLWDMRLLKREGLSPMAMQVWFSLDNAALQGLLWATLGRREKTPFQLRWQTFTVGPLLLLADAAYFRALAIPQALGSVVSAVRRTNVVVSFALGAAVFRERNLKRKALALGGILLGLALVLLG